MWIYPLVIVITLLFPLSQCGIPETVGTPDGTVVIDSHIPHDGYQLHYRLEGSANPSSPVVIFSNGVDCDLRIWSDAVELLKQRFPDFRFLRYDTRGYRPEGIDKPLNLTILTDDVEALLDALIIPKVHAFIGVSLGGTTGITFTIRFPHRVQRFVASDILINATLANSTAVDPRVQYAKTHGMAAIAPQLVAGWFTPEARNSSEWNEAIAMVSEASADGMGTVANVANGFYDTVNVKDLRRRGLYVLGAEDRACISFMEGFVAANKPNAGLRMIQNASHLSMWQQPAAWVDAVEDFLRK